MKAVLIVVLFLSVVLVVNCSADKGLDMISDKLEKLIASQNADEEEKALGEFLTTVRKTDVSYGYRVFNASKNHSVLPENLNAELEDELVVTIFVGDSAPYTEFKWHPKYNGHITRLIMP